ncbi:MULTISPECIES: GntR family transcriptional regulator [unclassified Methylobacterium]|uniref:GntR family transcriptional regulator n=1 Tax=unclassified Methylobacterium TaxID=2615210 RepID=UPI0011C1D3D4|nr:MULTISPECIES: GntR family transcriptional regulator [unclassified Methylobacterium]QEE39134.1 GntR family transcriptional regulator [Methylobacterium sp. WL1]TXM99556.1 GntR family transcriptional regulator [Methylobacterium sp. WL64]TXN55606.1 GntR family transcriptional regulator [Methylobacterium sp. WL2]
MKTLDASSYTTALNARREQSLGQMAYDKLLDMLVRRDLPAGTVLHERRLAEMLDISRTPTREAMSRLETEGLIERQPGGMLVVKEFSLRELIEILHVRRLLERESVVLAAGRIADAVLEDLQGQIEALLAAGDPDAPGNWEVDRRFHELFADHSQNAILAKTIKDLRLKTQMFNLSRMPERFEAVHREHLAVVAALRAGDAAAAADAIAAHLENFKLGIIRRLSEF